MTTFFYLLNKTINRSSICERHQYYKLLAIVWSI